MRNYLHDQHQIALNRMEVISYGEAKPMADNKTRTNRAMNRRVAFAEVRRYLRMPIRLERVDEATFDTLLRQAYEGGSDATMQTVEGLDDTTDLRTSRRSCPSRPTCSRARRRADHPPDQRACSRRR